MRFQNQRRTIRAMRSSESIVVLTFKVKGDIRYCCWYDAVKFLEHGMKVEKGC